MFGGCYRPSVYGGNFNAITYQATRPTGIDTLMQAVSPNAFHDSDNRPHPPKCHPNTRVTVIIDWATGMIDTDAFMFWFYGPAGAGKDRHRPELLAANGLRTSRLRAIYRNDTITD